MTMLPSRNEAINGVEPKLARSIAQACSDGWRTLGQIAWQVGCGEDKIASALPALAEQKVNEPPQHVRLTSTR